MNEVSYGMILLYEWSLLSNDVTQNELYLFFHNISFESNVKIAILVQIYWQNYGVVAIN